MNGLVDIEVVFALRDSQALVRVNLEPGATVRDAIDASGLATRFPSVDLRELQAGVWGQPVAHDQIIGAGDRVELYRPLLIDPREARRQLAASGLTMRAADSSDN